MTKDYYRKLITKNQLLKARLLDDDEFKHSEIVDSLCAELGGYVSANGEAPSIEKEASIVGYEVGEHKRLFEQVSKQGFEARDEQGRLFSPEVLHELHIRNVRSQAGKASAEARLLEQKPQQIDKHNPNYNYNSNDVSSSLDKEGLGGEGVSSSLLVDGKFVPWVAEVFELYPETTRTSDFYAASYWIEQLLGKKTVWGFAIEPEHIKLAVQHYCMDIKVGGYHGTDYVKNAENYFKDFKLVEKFLNPDWKPPRRKPKTYRKGDN